MTTGVVLCDEPEPECDCMGCSGYEQGGCSRRCNVCLHRATQHASIVEVERHFPAAMIALDVHYNDWAQDPTLTLRLVTKLGAITAHCRLPSHGTRSPCDVVTGEEFHKLARDGFVLSPTKTSPVFNPDGSCRVGCTVPREVPACGRSTKFETIVTGVNVMRHVESRHPMLTFVPEFCVWRQFTHGVASHPRRSAPREYPTRDAVPDLELDQRVNWRKGSREFQRRLRAVETSRSVARAVIEENGTREGEPRVLEGT